MKPLPCLAPWISLICTDSSYGPCCHIKFPAKRKELERAYAAPEALAKLFNNHEILTLRRRLLDNKLPHSCKACIKSGYNLEATDILKGEDHSPGVKEQIKRVHALVETGEIGDGLHPITIHLSQRAPCNLRCTFCEGAPPSPQNEDKAYRLFKQFFQTLEEIGWNRFHEIYIGGGEPFFNPGLLKFMYEFDWSKIKAVCIATVSNATMLHKHFDLLQRIDTLYIRLSIDATGDTYKKLRRGAIWEKTYANLQEMSRIMHEKPGWRVEIHAILMRSTLPYMTRLMGMAKALGFGFSVNSIRGNYIDENIFFFQDILNGLDWEKKMNESIDLARQCGYTEAKKTFKHLRLALNSVARGRKSQVQSLACSPNRLRMYRSFFASLSQKRFALWRTDHGLLDLLHQENTLPGLSFVLDRSDKLRTYCGYPYHSTADLEKNEKLLASIRNALDTIVVSSPTFKARQEMEVAQIMFPNCDVLLRPFWDEVAQRNMETIAESGQPYVAFGAGGTAWALLTGTVLRDSKLEAIADNNPELQGTEMVGKPVISPQNILQYADQVAIFSEAYYDDIRNQLSKLYGNQIRIVQMF